MKKFIVYAATAPKAGVFEQKKKCPERKNQRKCRGNIWEPSQVKFFKERNIRRKKKKNRIYVPWVLFFSFRKIEDKKKAAYFNSIG